MHSLPLSLLVYTQPHTVSLAHIIFLVFLYVFSCPCSLTQHSRSLFLLSLSLLVSLSTCSYSLSLSHPLSLPLSFFLSSTYSLTRALTLSLSFSLSLTRFLFSFSISIALVCSLPRSLFHTHTRTDRALHTLEPTPVMYGVADHKQLRHSRTLRHSTKHQYCDAITTQWFNHYDAIVHHDAMVESRHVHGAKFACHFRVEVWSAAKEPCDLFERELLSVPRCSKAN